MIFWDSSGIVSLFIAESSSAATRNIIGADHEVVVWWGSLVECYSAVARRRRENVLSSNEEDQVRSWLSREWVKWSEVEPSGELREIAAQLLLGHPLQAADSLQLAAALIWADKAPNGHRFVCLDQVLCEAARKEGFTVLPVGI